MKKVFAIIVLAVAVTGYTAYELIGLRGQYVSHSDYLQKSATLAAERIFTKDGELTLAKAKELIALASDQSLALVPITTLIMLALFNLILLFSALVYCAWKATKTPNN